MEEAIPTPSRVTSRRGSAARPACRVRGAHAHTLKNISFEIPFGQLTAITGVSGSGKSTLAFDTLYAEGQRRFVDCLSTYARQFLQRLERPDVEWIGEIQPPIALKQQNSIKNARSTVGSITEVSDLLQLLFAYASGAVCPHCGADMIELSSEGASDELRALPESDKLVLTAPLLGNASAPAMAVALQAEGYTRIYSGGAVAEWSPSYGDAPPDPGVTTIETARGPESPEPIELVIDRFTPRSLRRGRALESLREAWRLGHEAAHVYRLGESVPVRTLIRGLSCPSCGHRGSAPRPQLFSSNSPLGACPECNGFGRIITLDRDKVVPDTSLTLHENAVVPFSFKLGRAHHRRMLRAAEKAGVRTDAPFRKLKKSEREWVFTGDETFSGVEGLFRALDRKRYKAHVRIFQARFRGFETCPECAGSRRRREALCFRVAGRTIDDIESAPVRETLRFFDELELPASRADRVRPVLDEISARLRYLDEVGLGYLTLLRTGRTLSGGETQRIRLASALGTALTQTLYILDEPTVGLHASDTERMLAILRRLCETGNTVVVVEHDPGIIEGADHLLVLGPGGGEMGGDLLYEGPVAPFLRRNPSFFRAGSLEDAYPGRSGREERASSKKARTVTLEGVDQHNLRIERLDIPTDGLVCITGVSGSGKSTLIEDVLHRNAQRLAGKAVEDVGRVRRITGLRAFEEVLLVSQNPLGRSTRSNVITFVGLLALVRTLLSRTPAAKERKLRPSAFSFNVPGGRCEMCKGMGNVLLEMHFMADVEVTCETCKGKRFVDPVLEVTLGGRNILQILDLTVDEAAGVFGDRAEARRKLAPLIEVGLGYLKLGQSTATLSGGEAQRLKIASLLAEGAGEKPRLFLLDEPTSGLHPHDIERLLHALRRLLEQGHGVIVVEHQLDFVRASDFVVDLGPGGGDAGGRLLHAGPPGDLLEVDESITGASLAQFARTH